MLMGSSHTASLFFFPHLKLTASACFGGVVEKTLCEKDRRQVLAKQIFIYGVESFLKSILYVFKEDCEGTKMESFQSRRKTLMFAMNKQIWIVWLIHYREIFVLW